MRVLHFLSGTSVLFRGQIALWRILVAPLALLGAVCVAQSQSTARDAQTDCALSGLPSAERLSVSWRGDCQAGLANGVGDVFVFSDGKINYILRGQFTNGRLTRQDSLRACPANECADDVPPSLARLHRQLTPQPVAAATAVAPPTVIVPTDSRAKSVEIKAPDAVYVGAFVLDAKTGRISGEGLVKFNDGRSYNGKLENGIKVGIGTYEWADGQRYSGAWVNDLPSGRGEWSSKAGERYVGEFLAGRRDGIGTMTMSDGTRYEGQWKADLQNGRGKLTFSAGDEYEGDFDAGERSGKGVYRQKSGNTYTGEWLKGERHGQGVEQWANGQRYEGTWRKDRKEGSGVMRFPDASVYEGPWVNDQATGQGDIVFASGDTYSGQVKNGLPDGVGIFRWGSGDRFEGEFAAGKPTSKGQMTFFAEAMASAVAVSEPAKPAADAPVAIVMPPATPAAPIPSAAPEVAPVTRASLCFGAFNSARSISALKRFLDSFPDDECGRHALAKQKVAALEERERNASRAIEERIAQAKALTGANVAFRQEFTSCVVGTGASCERVTYVFDVKARVREIDVQRRVAQVQISEVTSLGNEKKAPSQLFSEGRSAATAAFKSRVVGTVQSKRLEEIGIAF
jgi:hypothetical protein